VVKHSLLRRVRRVDSIEREAQRRRRAAVRRRRRRRDVRRAVVNVVAIAAAAVSIAVVFVIADAGGGGERAICARVHIERARGRRTHNDLVALASIFVVATAVVVVVVVVVVVAATEVEGDGRRCVAAKVFALAVQRREPRLGVIQRPESHVHIHRVRRAAASHLFFNGRSAHTRLSISRAHSTASTRTYNWFMEC
jgi:hypothetical protein